MALMDHDLEGTWILLVHNTTILEAVKRLCEGAKRLFEMSPKGVNDVTFTTTFEVVDMGAQHEHQLKRMVTHR